MERLLSSRYNVVVLMVLLAAFSRLLPHPPNVTAIGAMALFAGAFLPTHWAWLVPLAAMWVSDLIINNLVFGAFYGQFVWMTPGVAWSMLGLVLIALLGSRLLTKVSVGRLLGASLSASLIFFLTSNAGSWLTHDLYPATLSGLFTAYIAGLPFFANTVLGDLFFTGLMFASFAWLMRRWPALRSPEVAA